MIQDPGNLALLDGLLDREHIRAPADGRSIIARDERGLLSHYRTVGQDDFHGAFGCDRDYVAVWTAADHAGWSVLVFGHVVFEGHRRVTRYAEYCLPKQGANRLARLGMGHDRVRLISGS